MVAKTKSKHGGARPGAGPKRKGARLSLEDIAYAIYLDCFGHLDDKNFQAEKTGEIHDWLASGDPTDRTLASLVTEWREYDAAEPNIK